MNRGFASVLIFCLAATTTQAEEPGEWAKSHVDELVTFYRQLHENPELSSDEEKTSARLAEQFKAAGYDVTTNVGGFGVVAILKNGAGPTLMLRADLDALPITEATGLTYASKVRAILNDGSETGVMHACGHDIHMTNLVGVARYLAANRDRWSGTLILIGQPAEEVGNGAQRMLADGLFKRFPKPDYAVALHSDSSIPTGKI